MRFVMRRLTTVICALSCWGVTLPIAAQSPSIRLHYGYFVPRMQSVNEQIETQINRWSEIIGESIPQPSKIDGDRAFGLQFQYPLNADDLLNLSVSYYRENVATEQLTFITEIPDRFFFERKVELYDVFLNLHHYFNYSTTHRLNYYVGFGIGASFTKARSRTALTNTVNSMSGEPIDIVDTAGDFTGSTLSLALAAGFDVRLVRLASLWAEVGLQHTKFGQLSGMVRTVGNPGGVDSQTDSTFDFTGVGARAGIEIALPFLNLP